MNHRWSLQWDLIGLVRLPRWPHHHELEQSYGLEDIAEGLRLELLGFDVGILEHESNHHSTILHEVMNHLVPELASFENLLNGVQLLDDPEVAWELRELRVRLQQDPARARCLEHYEEDERLEVVAVYGALKPVGR